MSDRRPAERPTRLARRFANRHRSAPIVVGVSGGGDSVGLLRLLHAEGLTLSVAHLDHGARGEESRADARFVGELAASLGLPFDHGRWESKRPGHFESDARLARYAWLVEVARKRGASVVAVGHTRDDQAETILHRIIRGTGPRGLSGIPPRRRLAEGITLARPLLDASRAAIVEYLRSIDQPFREDASNNDRSRTRARIRHDLLPRLAADYNPEVASALVRLARLSRHAAHGADQRIARTARAVVIEQDRGWMVVDGRELLALDPFDRAEVLRYAWRRAGWPEAAMDARRWSRLAAFIASDRPRISVGAGVEATLDPDTQLMTLARPAELPAPVVIEPAELPVPGSAAWGGRRIVATLDPVEDRDETVDLGRIVPPLVVRSARDGDRFDPLGLDGRTQALADFFRGRQVPRSLRPSVPVVCDQVGIVWVAGHRIAHRVRLTRETVDPIGLRLETP
ncbi:tRNA lysidine(34) synthetase TilS [Tundrisphaera sp. TA3]|uniref:tRNA lysidine(34) synthetase TilS n=1 Tax=Tundrisphaera sp. TA3 TaxID=3435775 RepID=UPI003EBA1012